jgi:DNA-binding CsgD family transcriptional regulator
METLDSQDIQKFNSIVQKLYSLNDFENFGVQAIAIMDQLVPSDIPSFHEINLSTSQISDTFLPSFPGFTPAMKKAQYQSFGEHPVIQKIPMTLEGAYKISDFINQQELHQCEGLYQQYLKPIGMEDHMTLCLPPTNIIFQESASFMAVALYRTQCNFTECDRLLLNLLRPHLFQAYCNTQKYHQLQKSLNQLGLIVLNTQPQVQSITNQAAMLLGKYFNSVSSYQGIPDLLWSWVKHQINNINTSTSLLAPALPLKIQQANKQLIIRLISEQHHNQYLILLEEQSVSLLDNLSLLGLSAKETEVLGCIMQGQDNRAIAGQLSIGISTVRKHLESIYSKLGVNSRTEAIAHALSKLGIL